MPPLGEVAHEMDVWPPKWKEVQEVVPCWAYKSAPDILKFSVECRGEYFLCVSAQRLIATKKRITFTVDTAE